MRHRKAGVHLSRTPAHRKALFSNLVAALFANEEIKTTHVKARATAQIAERTISLARRLSDVLSKSVEKRTTEEQARVVNAMREARKVVKSREAVQKLFDEIGPRYAARRGGYTRVVKVGQRPGDAAPMSILQLMPDDAPAAKEPKAEGKAPKASKKKAETAASAE
ncbi:MAG: 50S ribosomal protein L17 [Deltaproteobacteria bacterium]|nr:50S ribosomal protein L17 [Deltaproteobacteria bacterium]